MKKSIEIRGARAHNLKNIDVSLPRDKLIVFTGLSGSGKSSLAFDTIYAEGQRRYVESLSSYARQFLSMQQKPDVDAIEGLSPAISIEQKTTSRNPRSTVATVTEISDYLRLLYARVGDVHCYRCGKAIVQRSSTEIVNGILKDMEGQKLSILAPVVRQRKGEYKKLLQSLAKEGFARVRIDGEDHMLDAPPELNRKVKHDIDVTVDRLVVRKKDRARLADAVELALKRAEGYIVLVKHEEKCEELLSEHHACIDCGISYPAIEPRFFSFNAPQGACGDCSGLGQRFSFDESLVVPDPSRSLQEGALAPWGGAWEGFYGSMLTAVAKKYKFKMTTPWQDLSETQKKVVLYGSDAPLTFVYEGRDDGNAHKWTKVFEGVIPNLERRHRETQSDRARSSIEGYMQQVPCVTCKGTRLKPEANSVLVNGLSLPAMTHLSIENAKSFVDNLGFKGNQKVIASPILKEIGDRLTFLDSVGLGYLTLDRSAGTLSGGEAQRIRLASQIGSALMGVMYVLDEPSIGLHQRDNEKLIQTLEHLRDLGNTVIVVEHDEDTILASDYVVDLGPGAGIEGGGVVAAGTPKAIMKSKASLTGKYLKGIEGIEIPESRRTIDPKRQLEIRGACGNNLKTINTKIPLGALTCVSGVSGSGKSSLIIDTLTPHLMAEIYASKDRPLKVKSIKGVELLDKVIRIDQKPIGRTPRSNPATYTGLFDPIRALFADCAESKIRGYGPGRFSFNVKGGRCEKCEGDGMIKIEMNFLADVYVECEACEGRRYNPETLAITYRDKNIADVLAMSVAEALAFFKAHIKIARRLQTLVDVGLGYIKLGQSATTLSGGEAQRIKLSRELGKRPTGKTLYILDEPTTGLHFHDVKQLIGVLQRLVDTGNSVLVIEHNLDVIKCADWLVDLGPEGGDGGGEIVAEGRPEDVAKVTKSHTGRFLRRMGL